MNFGRFTRPAKRQKDAQGDVQKAARPTDDAREHAEGAKESTQEGAGKKRQRSNNIGPVIRDLLSGEFLTQEGVTRNIPYLAFVSGLFLLYISMGYHFERIEREKLNTRRKIEELNAEFKTLQADFEIRRQQSTLEADMADRGLIQPKTPPHLLQVNAADWKDFQHDL